MFALEAMDQRPRLVVVDFVQMLQDQAEQSRADWAHYGEAAKRLKLLAEKSVRTAADETYSQQLDDELELCNQRRMQLESEERSARAQQVRDQAAHRGADRERLVGVCARLVNDGNP